MALIMKMPRQRRGIFMYDNLQFVSAVICCGQLLLFQFSCAQGVFIEIFYFSSCPWRFPQEFQTGLYGRVADKAIDPDLVSQFFPAVAFYQLCNDLFKCYSV